ncbi:CHAT domain-containing protein [Serinibacter salmoneus]|uniref:CHAT domain-containing protein n=1 Tax=Serinibacter salmoneus TaxID=556530 RepID=A0A2A9CW26_9MICO|nr:CHAT domain-containing protein [Serinibacter salmoneus]PFG18628.1 CHAT domain-containing protein [Serinibacter salmoneus]
MGGATTPPGSGERGEAGPAGATRGRVAPEEWYDRAVAHANAGRLLRALTLLDRAARDAGADLAALIAGTRAYILAERGDPASAVTLCEGILAGDLAPRTRAIVEGQLGLVLIHYGDPARAAAVLDRAAAGLDDAPRELGNVLLNRGAIELEGGDLALAGSCFADAEAAFRRGDHAVGAAKAQHNAGIVAYQQGDLVRAGSLLEASRVVLAPLGPVMAAWCDLARADLLLLSGMPGAALPLLESAAGAFGHVRMRRQQAETLLTASQARSIVQPWVASTAPQARRLAARAARIYDSAHDQRGALRARARALALDLEHRPGPARLREVITLGEQLRARHMWDVSRELRRRAVAALASRGDLTTARAELRRLTPRADEGLLARVLHQEAGAAVASAGGQSRIAIRRARLGVDLVQRWQEEYRDLELRTSLAAHTRRLVIIGLRESLRIGDAREVLSWAEITRGVAARTAALRPPLRPTTPTPADLLARVWPALQTTRSVAISYVQTGSEVASVVLDPAVGRPRLVRLGDWPSIIQDVRALLADLDMAAGLLPEAIGAVVHASLRTRLRVLSDRLLRPLALPPTTRLVVVGPPALSALPWNRMPGLAGVAVSVAETLRDFCRRAGERPGAGRRIGFVAGPGLRNGEAEVTTAAAAWGSARILRGPDARIDAVAHLARSVDVLHVAAHGQHSAENPMFSGFELVDGTWYGFDIDQLDRVPQVVVLSACELGRSSAAWGQEMLGMARTWLHAGARCVIAAPARVSDQAALLTELHAGLAQGHDPASLLAHRQPHQTPATVSAFTCFGNGW